MTTSYLDTLGEGGSSRIFDKALPKRLSLIQKLPDTVANGKYIFVIFSPSWKKDLDLYCVIFDPCLFLVGWLVSLGLCLCCVFCFCLFLFFPLLLFVVCCCFGAIGGWFHGFLCQVCAKEEPWCRGTSCSGWCFSLSLTHSSSFMNFQLWQVECPEWSLIRLPLLIFSSLQLSSRKIVTSKSKQRGKCRTWETIDL